MNASVSGIRGASLVVAAAILFAACAGHDGAVPATPPGAPALSPALPPMAAPDVMATRPPIGAVVPALSTPQPRLEYFGGPVQLVPKIYVVFWGFGRAGADPDGVAARITEFTKRVDDGSWLDAIAQYRQRGGGGIQRPPVQLAGTWVDDVHAVPGYPTQRNVADEAYKLARHVGVYDNDADYIVATPHNHNSLGFKEKFCAYHSAAFTHWTGSASTSTWITYTNLPYIPDAGYSCGASSVNPGAAGALDGVTIVLGHELAESRTDPLPYIGVSPPYAQLAGWYDKNGYEVADKCAWVLLQNNQYGGTELGLDEFPNQPLWSNASRQCVQN